jgi:putative phosphoribosyl transferase
MNDGRKKSDEGKDTLRRPAKMSAVPIVEVPRLRDRVRVFRDREHAGEILSDMLTSYGGGRAVVLAVPSGGVPCAAVVAEKLRLPLEAAIVSKITLPWNSEVGYGAVAFDGTVLLNEELIRDLALTDEDVRTGQDDTLRKVARRVKKYYGDEPYHIVSDRAVILIDDGLASGFTLLTAVEALRKYAARDIAIAVPTGSFAVVHRMARHVNVIYCANIRSGMSFAVADAYERWFDVDETEAVSIYKHFREIHRDLYPTIPRQPQDLTKS